MPTIQPLWIHFQLFSVEKCPKLMSLWREVGEFGLVNDHFLNAQRTHDKLILVLFIHVYCHRISEVVADSNHLAQKFIIFEA